MIVFFNIKDQVYPISGQCPFLYPLKRLANPSSSDVFRGYIKGTLGTNNLMVISQAGSGTYT